MTNVQKLGDTAHKLGADNTAVALVSELAFNRQFRDICAKNTCGHYGACWMCPPDAGDIDEMIAKAKTYNHIFVFQTISRLEDSFDIEGMNAAAKKHNELLQTLTREANNLLGYPVKLGAGACHVCVRCAKHDNEPCRYPKNATASLEAYGIDVYQLAELCGMRYTNGQNTVTFFGGFLFI
jgi:Predicted metal-binding protein